MQVDFIHENSVTFKISNTLGDDAVEVFYNVMKKCNTEASKKGFRNMFNSEEKSFLKEFNEKINGDEVKY